MNGSERHIAQRARERHPGLIVEHPPEVWSAAGAVDSVDGLVDALVTYATARTEATDGLVLLVSNVVVARDDDGGDGPGGGPPPGEHLALTVESDGLDVGDSVWVPGAVVFLDDAIDGRARAAGAVYGYTRGEPRPSITCFLPRG